MDSQLIIFSESLRKCPGEKHCQSILLAFIPLGFCLCVCVCVCVCARACVCARVCVGARVCSQSCPTLSTPWTVACQAPLSVGFSRQEHWSGLSSLSPRDLPGPGIKPESLASPTLAGSFLPLCRILKPGRSVLMHHLSKSTLKASQLQCQHSKKPFYIFKIFVSMTPI